MADSFERANAIFGMKWRKASSFASRNQQLLIPKNSEIIMLHEWMKAKEVRCPSCQCILITLPVIPNCSPSLQRALLVWMGLKQLKQAFHWLPEVRQLIKAVFTCSPAMISKSKLLRAIMKMHTTSDGFAIYSPFPPPPSGEMPQSQASKHEKSGSEMIFQTWSINSCSLSKSWRTVESRFWLCFRESMTNCWELMMFFKDSSLHPRCLDSTPIKFCETRDSWSNWMETGCLRFESPFRKISSKRHNWRLFWCLRSLRATIGSVVKSCQLLSSSVASWKLLDLAFLWALPGGVSVSSCWRSRLWRW